MVFMVVAFHFFGKDAKAFVITCLAYFSGLVLIQFLLYWNVPQSLRVRPPVPMEYHLLRRIGNLSPDVRRVIESGNVLKERQFGNKLHRLYRNETIFPNGSWIAWTEVVDQSVVAWTLEFKSNQSPVLNYGNGSGSGKFIGNQGV